MNRGLSQRCLNPINELNRIQKWTEWAGVFFSAQDSLLCVFLPVSHNHICGNAFTFLFLLIDLYIKRIYKKYYEHKGPLHFGKALETHLNTREINHHMSILSVVFSRKQLSLVYQSENPGNDPRLLFSVFSSAILGKSLNGTSKVGTSLSRHELQLTLTKNIQF